MDLNMRLRKHTGLTPTDQCLRDYFLRYPERAVRMNTRQLAEATFTSPSAVVRFCRKFGYQGLQDFKTEYFSSIPDAPTFDLPDGDFPFQTSTPPETLVRDLLKLEEGTLHRLAATLDLTAFNKAAAMLSGASVIDLCAAGSGLYLLEEFSFRLISLQGGLPDNAIPREASAELLFDAGCDMQAVSAAVASCHQIYAHECQISDPSVALLLTVSDTDTACEAISADDTQKIITALVTLPNGVQRMSLDIEGLVQTSLNLGILSTEEKEVTFACSVRSSVGTEKEELIDRLTCLIESLGGHVTIRGDYPAWEYRKDSPLRDLMIRIFEKQYGKKPIVQALHAGVECGLFSGKLPGLDCVSFGPDMDDIHTPKESMHVDSVVRTWNYTLEILKELK